MKVSSNLYEFHKLCEGVHNKAYFDPVGILTIGVGHANQETASFTVNSEWTPEKVKEVWELDIAKAEHLANKYLDGVEVEQCYFDALTDIIFNTGANPRTLVKYLKEGKADAAKAQLIRWVYSNGVVLLGLVKRRFAMYAYCHGHADWLDVANIPLSSNNLKDFNAFIKQFGYEVERINAPQKFCISRMRVARE